MCKRKIITIIISSFLVLTSCFFIACNKNKGSNESEDGNKTVVSIDKQKYTAKEDTEFTLTATVTPNGQITWISSDTKIASVDGGKVMAKSAGTVEIKAQSGNAYAVCNVVVTPSNTTTILSSNEKQYYVEIGGAPKQFGFTAYELNKNGTETPITDAEITYSLPNSRLVKIENGKLVGISSGIVLLKATYGDLTETVEVTVCDKFISNAYEWNAMLAKRKLGEIYLIDEDIDFTGVNYSGQYVGAPENSRTNAFQATLIGNGHKVKNVTLTGTATNYVSLFGIIYNAKISGINFENITFTGSLSNCAGLATALCGNSTVVKDIMLDVCFNVVPTKGCVLLNKYNSGNMQDVMATVKTPNANTADDKVVIIRSGVASFSDVFVKGEGRIDETDSIFSTVSDIEFAWKINGEKPFNASVWAYSKEMELPSLKIK